MTEISTLVDNYGGQNKNNSTIRFLSMIKEGGLFGMAIFHFYIRVHTNNDCDRAFNSLKVIYRKQNVFNFEKCCENLNTRNNIEVIQISYEKFFDLESFLNDLYDRPDPKNVNINHIFQVKISWHTLVIVKSSMSRQSIRSTMPTVVHRGRE